MRHLQALYLQRLNEGGVAPGRGTMADSDPFRGADDQRHYPWHHFVSDQHTARHEHVDISWTVVRLMAGAFGFAYLLNFVINLAYETYFVSAHGGTPGKLLLGLRVIRADVAVR